MLLVSESLLILFFRFSLFVFIFSFFFSFSSLGPFSWGTDAVAINEFSAGKYNTYDDNGVRLGASYLASFGLRDGPSWQWAAIAYLWGFYIVLSVFSSMLLMYSTPTQPMGTKRTARPKTQKQLAELKEQTNNQNVRIEVAYAAGSVAGGNNNTSSNGRVNGVDSLAIPQAKRLGGGAKSSAKASFQLSSLPFTPATLSWKDLKYTVYIGKEKTPRVLLNHISGFAEPGKLTALMGASGAGKVRCITTPTQTNAGLTAALNQARTCISMHLKFQVTLS